MNYFVTWSQHRRTRELARQLQVELVEITSRRRGLGRYAEVVHRTVAFLLARRPHLLIVQSPSMVLAALATFLRPLFGYVLIVDAHNEAVEPYVHPTWPVRWLATRLLRAADHVIVTNDALADIVRSSGGAPLVLADPIPITPIDRYRSSNDSFRVVVISTYATDEPINQILGAANLVGVHVEFLVTGNSNRLDPEIKRRLPANVKLTGFLPEHAYWDLLASASVVLDLTEMPNCLVCGAYEALALGVPVILSDDDAGRKTFGEFAEFTKNDSQQIARALDRVRSNHAALVAAMPTARSQFEDRWACSLVNVQNCIAVALTEKVAHR